jgi:hypothetical protein
MDLAREPHAVCDLLARETRRLDGERRARSGDDPDAAHPARARPAARRRDPDAVVEQRGEQEAPVRHAVDVSSVDGDADLDARHEQSSSEEHDQYEQHDHAREHDGPRERLHQSGRQRGDHRVTPTGSRRGR